MERGLKSLQIPISDLFQYMPIEQIFGLVQEAKGELEKRYKRDSVYEPTGRQDIDDAHDKRMHEFKNVLEKLKDI